MAQGDDAERRKLVEAVERLEARRPLIGEEAADSAIAALREKIRFLDAQEPSRRILTVMFADVSGFTALSETMDAEDLADLVNRLWSLVDGIIRSNGGSIDKHIGDEVAAVWGAEGSREDDPERAVRCALEIQSALAGFSSAEGRSIGMRIGINTGPVLLGEVASTREFTVMGDAVNLASRLQHAAPVGGVMISASTHALVRGLFETGPFLELDIRGKKEPVQACTVIRPSPRSWRSSGRGIDGVRAPMVGRDAQFAALKNMALGREGGFSMVIGEAGIGKSRLLAEFEEWLSDAMPSLEVMRGRADESMQDSPCALLRDLFGLQPAGGPRTDESLRSELEGRLAPGGGRAELERAHFIGQFLGYDFSSSPALSGVLGGEGREPDPRQLRERAVLYLGMHFREMSVSKRVLILLEDIHWADESSLEAVEQIVLDTRSSGLLVVCTARPSLLDRRSVRDAGFPDPTIIRLDPLDEENSESLLDGMGLTEDRVPPETRAALISAADGNPFYLEELVRMLMDDGVLIRSDGRWRTDGEKAASLRVPENLASVLQARFDRLPAGERTLLQRASVVGRRFWEGALESMGRCPGTTVGAGLENLERRGLVAMLPSSSIPGAREFSFRHSLLRDAVYDSVLRKDRRRLHSLAADWIMERASGRLDELAMLAAEHLERAGRDSEASTLYERAGASAASRFSNAEAAACYSRALALLRDGDPADASRLLAALSRIHEITGDRESQRRDVEALEALAPLLDTRGRAQVLLRRSGLAALTNDYGRSVELAREALRLAGEIGDAGLEVAACIGMASSLQNLSEHRDVLDDLVRGLELAREHNLPGYEARLLLHLGNFFADTSDYDEADRLYRQAMRSFREAGDARGEGYALHNLGLLAMDMGDSAAARSYFEQSLQLDRQTGDRRGEAHSLVALGLALQARGDLHPAEEAFSQARRVYSGLADRLGEATVLNNLGILASETGDYDQALERFQEAARSCASMGVRSYEANTLDNMSLTLLRAGDLESALACSDRVVSICDETGDRSLLGIALAKRGHMMFESGRFAEAESLYEEAAGILGSIGSRHLEMEAVAGAARAAMAAGGLEKAADPAMRVRDFLGSGGSLDEVEDPFRAYLAVFEVLSAMSDSSASAVLEAACAALTRRSESIRDPLSKERFLGSTPQKRSLLAARASLERAAGGASR